MDLPGQDVQAEPRQVIRCETRGRRPSARRPPSLLVRIYDVLPLQGGIAYPRGVYPEGYRPWSRPTLYDTSQPGRSNAGHELPGLSDGQKRALLEYLKVL